MGNNPSTTTTGLCLINGDRSYQVQLGESAVLYFKGRSEDKREDSRLAFETWKVSYKVDNSTCNITLSKRKDMNSIHDEHLHIIIDDAYRSVSTDCFLVCVIEKNAAGVHLLLSIFQRCSSNSGTMPDLFRITPIASSTTNAWGVVTETSLSFYGSGTRLGLIVCERKKKRKDEEPYMGTVAHYYVNTENGQDVGLSIALKRIRVLDNGHLDFTVDGPEQHPASALIYMFNEVRRTGTWKPAYCPHCANNIIQRQRAGVWPSESESDTDNVAAPPPHGHRRNAGNIVSNSGWFRGHNIGNTFVKYFNGRR